MLDNLLSTICSLLLRSNSVHILNAHVSVISA